VAVAVARRRTRRRIGGQRRLAVVVVAVADFDAGSSVPNEQQPLVRHTTRRMGLHLL